MALPSLLLTRLAVVLDAERDVVLGAAPGSVVRSALGGALRGLACRTGEAACGLCAVAPGCAYGVLFGPGPSEAGPDAVRPYVLTLDAAPSPFEAASPDVPPVVARGGRLTVGLTLVGRAAAAAVPHVIAAFRQLERTGLGDDRERGAGRVRVAAVDAVHGPTPVALYRAGDGGPMDSPPPVPFAVPPCPGVHGDALVLRALTPLVLRRAGRTLSAPTFGEIVTALVRRARLLGAVPAADAVAGDAPAEDASAFDARAFDVLADAALDAAHRAVPLVPCEGAWVPARADRWSTRQQQRLPLDGVRGTLGVGPGWEAAWPFLALGAALHVGHHATHGLGRLALAALPCPVPAPFPVAAGPTARPRPVRRPSPRLT